MKKATETMISAKNRAEADEIMDTVMSLSVEEQKGMLAFLQGIQFAKKIQKITA